MSQKDISCGLDYTSTPNLPACLTEALRSGYSFIISPIVHPRFRRPCSGMVGGFARPDLILSPQDWTTTIVGKVSPYLNVDAPSPGVRQRHEVCLIEELSYCYGLILPAIMLSVHGRESNNLTRILNSFFETSPSCIIWAHVPMTCTKIMKNCDNEIGKEAAWDETWLWWSKFHERLEWDKRAGVALELSADFPTEEVVLRWLGEPVKAIIVPTSIFHKNRKGYPVLSRAHQRLVVSFVKHEAKVIVSGARRFNIEFYLQYLRKICEKRPHLNDTMFSFAKRWNDYMHNPLRPLAANLGSLAYDVFEKDPIKYEQYETAIALALTDLQKGPNQMISTGISKEIAQELGQGDHVDHIKKTVTVMVLGAGKGLLVRATLNAADRTNSQVKVVAVEKNPCVADTLAAQARGVWRDHDVVVIPGDMRHINLLPRADIIVSELQGSWGDSALSPECLNGAVGLLEPGGISIPCKYTSYVAPISSPRLWAAAKTVSSITHSNQERKNLETVWITYMQNKHNIAEAKPVFRFEYSAKGSKDHEDQEITDHKGLPLMDNIRSETLTWEVQQNNVIHGFEGYFDCNLYREEMINTHPSINNPGKISWFPVFIPIKTPLRVHKGEIVTARFWRCKDAHKVWYEWIVEVGSRTTILHNANGRSSHVLL